MSRTATLLVPSDPAPRWLRLLVVAEIVVLVLPLVFVAAVLLFGMAKRVDSSSRDYLTGDVFLIAQIAVALLAMCAMVHAAIVFFRRGADGVSSLSAFTMGAMHAGAVLVLAGLIAVPVTYFLSLGPFGTLIVTNLVGVPVLIPYRALMRVRRRAATSADTFPVTSRRAIWGPVLAGGLIVAALIALGPRPFDETRWRSARSSLMTHAPRLQMSHWLAATGALRGLSREEVVAMLGQPPHTDLNGYDFLYPLEPSLEMLTWFRSDLAIRFDEQGRVIDECICTFD